MNSSIREYRGFKIVRELELDNKTWHGSAHKGQHIVTFGGSTPINALEQFPISVDNYYNWLEEEKSIDITPIELARLFHDWYEKLAPNFGYETREETRQFDANTNNGLLMIATCNTILDELNKRIK